MPHATTRSVLFIDAYDSFTNNIVALLETHLHVSVTTIKIDEPISNFTDFLRPFSAVIAGPGPGDPRNPKDVGWIQELWKLEGQDVVPVLGICLGFQSLVLAFGGTVDRLGEPRHGVVRRVRGNGESLFRGVDEVETVQYHSLHASLGPPAGKYRAPRRYDSGRPSLKCSNLRPLAWDYEMDNYRDGTEDDVSLNERRVLMAVEHKSKPFFGIQFHAESICSNSNAQKVIEAWWEIVKNWRRPYRENGPLTLWSCGTDTGAIGVGSRDAFFPPKSRISVDDSKHPSISIRDVRSGKKQNPRLQDDLNGCNGVSHSQYHGRKRTVRVIASVIDVGEASIPSICEKLGLTEGEAIILDSEMHQRHDVGEHSIIGFVSPASLRLEYRVGTDEVGRIYNGQSQTIDLRHFGGSIFSYLKFFLGEYKVESSEGGVPFWGGLMGFISYEACVETIGVPNSEHRSRENSQRPDLCFTFVERSIVVDHFHGKIHIQTIKPDDQDWIDTTTVLLKSTRPTFTLPQSREPLSIGAQIDLPNAASYKSKVRACQSAIRAGDSYELCLTTQATIHTSTRLAAWQFYLRLRTINPAPFSAYVRLGNLTLLSSSPERFLQWSRPCNPAMPCTATSFDQEEKAISCQFLPIKGSVQRQPEPILRPLTLAEATALLATPKERAENLMIVDLIRHDLHGGVGSGRVTVPKLMVVEEYATLFQLVSVVEGSLIVGDDHNDAINNEINEEDNATTPNTPDSPIIPNAKTGLDILAASLPPGSMTGAPKLRSCQLLQSLESRPRGIYSGVLGYLDIGGGGDFSVLIRSAVRCDHDARPVPQTMAEGDDTITASDSPAEDNKGSPGDEWTIGAGGAVTSLSTEEGEWEEMCAKMRSTLRLFE